MKDYEGKYHIHQDIIGGIVGTSIVKDFFASTCYPYIEHIGV